MIQYTDASSNVMGESGIIGVSHWANEGANFRQFMKDFVSVSTYFLIANCHILQNPQNLGLNKTHIVRKIMQWFAQKLTPYL